MYPRGMYGAVEGGEAAAIRFFNSWREEVVREVPGERLLVWQVGQGWDPLCQVCFKVQPPHAPVPWGSCTRLSLPKHQ